MCNYLIQGRNWMLLLWAGFLTFFIDLMKSAFFALQALQTGDPNPFLRFDSESFVVLW